MHVDYAKIYASVAIDAANEWDKHHPIPTLQSVAEEAIKQPTYSQREILERSWLCGIYIASQSNKEALAMAIEALEARNRMEHRMNKIIADEKALDKPSD